LKFLKAYPLAVILIIFLAGQSLLSGSFTSPLDWIMGKLIILPAILIGLSFHEFAHAFAADRLGDSTPRLQGRVTINPAAHIDPFGILALIFIGFGWGKPVMVNEYNFKNRRRDSLIVDLAGVVTNFILAVIFTGIVRLIIEFAPAFLYSSVGNIVREMLTAVISINIVLMIFNLLPVPPLDGFGVITELFNLKRYSWYYTVYNNGFMILMLLLILNITDIILVPAVNAVFGFVIGIFF